MRVFLWRKCVALTFLRFLGCELRVDEPEAGGGSDPDTFSRDYVHALREEAKGHRLRAADMEERLKTMESQAAERLAASEQRAQARIVQVELRAAALRAGIVDVEALRLADISGLSLGEDGEVAGVDALLLQMKQAKPYLFAAINSSTPGSAPTPRSSEGRKATEMSEAEYRQEKARVLGLR